MSHPNSLLPSGAEHFHETTDDVLGRHRYCVVRFYRRGVDTFRVTVERDSYAHQSCVVAEVLTASRRWSLVISNAPSNWHSTTSLYGTKRTQADPEPGFTWGPASRDALATDAMTIVSTCPAAPSR